jgi:hypothetical protein
VASSRRSRRAKIDSIGILGASVDNALIAVAGTLAGTLLGAALTWFGDRVKRRHEERTRWYADRRRVYGDFLHAAHSFWRRGQQTAYEYGAALRDPSRNPLDAFIPLKEVEEEVWRSVRDIELVGQPPVVAASRRAATAVSQVAGAEFATLNAPSAESLARRDRVYADVAAALEQFKTEARRDIGTGSA